MPILRRIMLCTTIVMLLLSLTLMGACQPAPPAETRGATEAEQAVDELAQDIELLYTLNRLDLQPAQLNGLYAAAVQAQEARAKLQPQRQVALAQLVPLLREKRALLLQDREVPEELDTQLRQAQTRVENVEEQMMEATVKSIPAARQALSDEQIAIITGADEANTQVEELLQWVRELEQADYADEARANAEELADPEVKLSAADIMKIFDEVRKLSDADYQTKREQYIAKLAPLYSPVTEAVDDSLAQFLGSPRLAVLLQERGAK